MSEGMMAKAGATTADAAASLTAPEAIVAPASNIGCSGTGEWQLNPTHLFASRAGHALLCAPKYTQSILTLALCRMVMTSAASAEAGRA